MTALNEAVALAPGAALVRISAAEYHRDPCPEPSLSSSVAKLLVDRSPAHARAAHPRFGGESNAPSAAMDRGSLIHKLVLDAGAPLRVIEADDWRTKAAREQRETARDNGEIPVLARVHAEASKVAETIRARLADRGVVLDGESELACVWTEQTVSGPIWCRSLFDHVRESGVIYDLKSSVSAHPRACVRHVLDYGYDIQRAAYVRALERARPELAGRVEVVFLFVELEPPYAVLPARLDGRLRAYGERRWITACEAWGQALRTDYWPAYTDDSAPVYLEAPGWLDVHEDA